MNFQHLIAIVGKRRLGQSPQSPAGEVSKMKCEPPTSVIHEFNGRLRVAMRSDFIRTNGQLPILNPADTPKQKTQPTTECTPRKEGGLIFPIR